MTWTNLQDVCPSLATNDQADRSLIDAESLRKRRLRLAFGSKRADQSNIVLSQFSLTMRFATARPFLDSHISKIVCVATQEQMPEAWQDSASDFIGANVIVPYAETNITRMTCSLTRRQRSSNRYLKCDSVDESWMAAERECSIAVFSRSTTPYPTGLRFVDALPEFPQTLLSRRSERSAARLTAKLPVLRRDRREHTSAGKASNVISLTPQRISTRTTTRHSYVGCGSFVQDAAIGAYPCLSVLSHECVAGAATKSCPALLHRATPSHEWPMASLTTSRNRAFGRHRRLRRI